MPETLIEQDMFFDGSSEAKTEGHVHRLMKKTGYPDIPLLTSQEDFRSLQEKLVATSTSSFFSS